MNILGITMKDVGLYLCLSTITFIIVGILTALVLEAIKDFFKEEQ